MSDFRNYPNFIGIDFGSKESETVFASHIRGQLILHDAIPMTRAETVSRRFEAMRMRWPEKWTSFIQQEMLILADWSNRLSLRGLRRSTNVECETRTRKYGEASLTDMRGNHMPWHPWG